MKVSTRTASTLSILVLLLAYPCVSQAAERLTRIQFWSMGTSTRISMEFTGEFQFKSAKIDKPDRIFFDIPNTTFNLEGKSKGMYQLAIGDNLVKQIRVANQSATQTRVVVDLEADAEYTVAELKSPNRLVIEVASAAGKPSTPSETPSVTATIGTPASTPEVVIPRVVPTKQFEPPTTTTAKVHRTVNPPAAFDSPPAMDTRVANPNSKALQTANNSASLRVSPPPRASSSLSASNSPSNIPIPTPANANTGGDRSLTRALGLKLRRIVIDAGHGAHDDGSTGPGGLKEKDLVLDIALRVGKLVQERIGAEVIYTRDTDIFIPLEERPVIANNHHADLFLSIHANSSTLQSVTGVETYFLSVASTRQALEVAARENAASTQSIADLETLVQKITLNEKIKESMEFAGSIQNALSTGTGTAGKARNRGVRKAPFIVLIGAKMPAILAEVGFISNPQEERAMMTSEYRDKLAEALVKGLESYGQTLSRFQLATSPKRSESPAAVEPVPVPTRNTSTGGGSSRRTVAARARRAGASN